MTFIDLSIASRLEDASAWRSVRYAQAQDRLCLGTQSTVMAVGGGCAIYAGPGAPMNQAKGLGMSGPVTPEDLAAVARFYRSLGEIPRVDLCPLAHASLLDLLKQEGYRLEGFHSVLLLSISEILEPVTPSSRVDVRSVASDEAALWRRTVAQGFSEEDAPPQAMLDLIAPTFHSETATNFLAWVDGQPAGGGTMLVHKGVAEFCSASTRPAFRRRGVQRALLYARLAAARAAGCDLAMVITVPGSASQRNVQRLGFQLAYTKAMMVGPPS